MVFQVDVDFLKYYNLVRWGAHLFVKGGVGMKPGPIIMSGASAASAAGGITKATTSPAKAELDFPEALLQELVHGTLRAWRRNASRRANQRLTFLQAHDLEHLEHLECGWQPLSPGRQPNRTFRRE